MTDVDAVVQQLEGLFRSNLSFTLHVGYGEVNGSQLSSNDLGESEYSLNSFSYTQIKNALASNASDVDQASSVASLPTSDPINGSHTYWIPQTEAMAMGLLPTSTAINEYVGFSSTANFDYNLNSAIGSSAYDFFGTVAHEITEVMGRELGVG